MGIDFGEIRGWGKIKRTPVFEGARFRLCDLFTAVTEVLRMKRCVEVICWVVLLGRRSRKHGLLNKVLRHLCSLILLR